MGFGPKQINNPVPRSISTMFDMLAGAMGIVNSFLVMATFIPHLWSDTLSCILTGLFIPLLLYFKNWFGQEINTTTVKSDDVTGIKDPPTKP